MTDGDDGTDGTDGSDATGSIGGRDGIPRAGNDGIEPPRHGGPDRTDREGSDGDLATYVVDFLTSALAVAGIGVLLFAVSGVWPPLVAIESPSMTPHIAPGDLVFVMEEDRFPGPGAVGDTGVVTARGGADTGYEKFARPGDVIVYRPNGNGGRTPIIHRAMFWVTEGENWYDEADPDYLPPDVDDCGDLGNCPAPHGGFITLGDANGFYDQVRGPDSLSGPVRPGWIVGTGEFRIPFLGWIRLGTGTVGPVGTIGPADTVGSTGAVGPVGAGNVVAVPPRGSRNATG